MADTPDRRRRQYIPIDVYFASGGTGTTIRRHYGLPGLAVWIAYLAACKRSTPQGQLTYASEADAWEKLGLADTRPDFTLHDFFRLTGRLHKTSTQRASGELTTTTCRVWDEWQQNIRRAQDADKKRRKRAENTGDKPPTNRRRNADKPETIRGTEGEGEDNPLVKASPSPSPTGGRRRSAPRASSLRAAEPPPNGDATIDPEGIKRIADIMRTAALTAREPDPSDDPADIAQRQAASRRRLERTEPQP